MDINYIIFLALAVTAVILSYLIYKQRLLKKSWAEIRILTVSLVVVIVLLFFMNVFVGFIA